MPLNNISPTRIYQSQFHYFHSSPHVAPIAPQVIPSPSKGRKCKSKAAGRGGGGGKRQRVPAPIVPTPSSTVRGTGPTIPATSLLSDNDPSLSSPQLPIITPTESLQTPSASAQISTASYSSLPANRKASRATSRSRTDLKEEAPLRNGMCTKYGRCHNNHMNESQTTP
ncbi:hypothetical protein BGY98DRAFT_410433 [Russula aff. rugulosa BPL654]|nr:hypothetical protein BGY98DRAFT_410433 [Russula aff. rugulosa BPL654]